MRSQTSQMGLAAHIWKPIAIVMLVVVSSAQQQVTTPDSSRPTARPAYEPNKGPVIAIDEAHKNTHTYASPPFRGLVELLQRDGYRPRPFPQAISASSLKEVDVLILGGPGGWEGPDASLSDAEVTAVMEWIRGGGSLLLLLDHMPAPLNNAKLAAALGWPIGTTDTPWWMSRTRFQSATSSSGARIRFQEERQRSHPPNPAAVPGTRVMTRY